MSKPVIELKNVSKWYESDPDRRVLDGINLDVPEGGRFAIVGPSGCGKSTLLNLLGTLDTPSEGSIAINGTSIEGRSEKELAAIRSEQIGFIFQLHHLLPQCSALENVLVPTLALPVRPDTSELEKRARKLFDDVGLGGKLDSKPGQLSGGERQRVAVIRALINQPKILLADEPTGALDEENAEKLVQLLVKLNESENLALIMVTHDQELASTLGDVRTLKAGKLVSLKP
ncbi:MAG: ABC transporter ATP-binding protein [Verrucomicrobiales bacterium]|nr:ABC transporter ATP-binding protein [Verrucomicrobiales bacterium]